MNLILFYDIIILVNDMSSRMDRYENSELGGLSRTKRNQDIYNSTNMSELSIIKTNVTKIEISNELTKDTTSSSLL